MMLGNDLGMMWKFISSSLERITLSLIEGVTQKIAYLRGMFDFDLGFGRAHYFHGLFIGCPDSRFASSTRVMPTCRATF